MTYSRVASSIQPLDASAQPGAIPLGTGTAGDGMPPESWFSLFGQATVRNVGTATLTPILPDPGKATGAAVVIAPGGAFVMQSMANEGWAQAHWLAERGVAAFILKYRLLPTPADLEAFTAAMIARFAAAAEAGGTQRREAPVDAIADGQAAMRLVRARAAEWGVDPRRVGYFGSSAGATLGLGIVAAGEADAMPDFLAAIYPPMAAVTVSAAAPPLFAAIASDGPLFGTEGFALAEAWRLATGRVELHVYERGSHGFGMGVPGTTSVGLMDAFHAWLRCGGWLDGGID